MAAHDLDEIEAAFDTYGAPGTGVMSAADLVADPHVAARGMILSVPDADLGSIRMQGIVPKLSESPGEVRHAGQRLGESNELIYGELLGMSSKRILALREKGVI